MTPATKAGQKLAESIISRAISLWSFDEEGQGMIREAIASVENEARVIGFREGLEHAKATYGPGHRLAALDEVREEVEKLIARAGGRCVKPVDYSSDGINICETHSEIIYDEGCEDQPRQLVAVLTALDQLAQS